MLISNQNYNTIGDNSLLSGRDTNINVMNIGQNSLVSLLENTPDVDSNYVERKREENALLETLKESNVVQVYGISGIGKTEIVKKVVGSVKNNYDRCYWISCNNYNEIDLENISTLLGIKINLTENIKREKLIIVIDNYNSPIESITTKFEKSNLKSSKLIFSSQERTSSCKIKKVPIGYMDFNEAYKIFEVTKNDEFKTEEFKKFLNKIDRHPMMLQILKNYILDKDNGINFCDFKDRIQFVLLEDDEISQSQKICEKIVGAYYDKSKLIYQFLSLVNSNIIEECFLKSIAISEIPALIKKAFLKYNKDHYYIHSIILDSISAVVKNDSNNKNIIPYESQIIDYLEKQLDVRNIEYYKFVAYNNNFIKNLYKISNNKYLKILLYNCFMSFSNYHDIQIHINNIESLINENQLKKYYEVKLLIELVELKIKVVGKEDKEKREECIQSSIEKLEGIKQNVKNDKKCIQLLDHHIAKLYNWVGKYDQAINILKKIIETNNKEYAAILQLCRAYRQKIIDNKGNKEQVNKYLNATFSILSNLDYKKMPISIYLELVVLIINRPLNENRILKVCFWDNFDYFSETALLYSKNNIFEHIYLTIGHLASTLSYNKKEFYKEWFKEIEHPNFNESSNELLMAIINIYCSEVKRRKYNNEQYNELVNAIGRFWSVYKDKYISNLTDSQKNFVFKPIIEFYIVIGKYNLAQNELDQIYNNSNEWHLKFQSLILKGLKKYSEAKEKIEKAIEVYTIKGEVKYKASFYKDYAEVLYDMENKDCLEKLKYAIQICDHEKTKKSWENKLKVWKKEYE